MTLVANFSINGWPILIGDLLLSQLDDGRDRIPVKTPLHDDPNQVLYGKRSEIVAGLSQKVVLVTPRLAVAWAGAKLEAEFAICRLERHVSDHGYDVDQIIQLLDKCCNNYTNLYLTGLLLSEPSVGKIATMRFSWPASAGEQTRLERHGNCFFGGTGGTAFGNLIRNAELWKIKSNRSLNECERAVFQSLLYVAQLSGEQARVGTGLESLYGGGFEIVTLFGRELKKVGEVAYHLWEARCEQKGNIRVTFHSLLKFSYEDAFLHVRRLRFYTPPELSDDDCFVVGPVHKPLLQTEAMNYLKRFSPPKLESKFSVIYVHVPQAPQIGEILHFLHFSGQGSNQAFRVRPSGNGNDCEIEMSEDLQTRLHARVQQAVSPSR